MDSVGVRAGGLDRGVGASPNPTAPARPHLPDENLPAPAQPGAVTEPPVIDADEFQRAFDEPLDRVLDIEKWHSGAFLAADWERIEREKAEALEQQNRTVEPIRRILFPRIAARSNAPKGAGVFQATEGQLKAAQMNILFNGAVEACDGTPA